MCNKQHAAPPQDVFHLIDQHFAARAAISSIDSQLEQQETTFRSIQKRLLVRYNVSTHVPSLHKHMMPVAEMRPAMTNWRSDTVAVGD